MLHRGRSRWSALSSALGASVIVVGGAVGALSCAKAGDEPPPGDPADASTPKPVDASDPEPDDPDAAVDARVSVPDARPGAPDARPSPPDARIDPADANVSVPDAGPIGGGFGPWTGRDRLDPSPSPPFGVPVQRAPQFVTLGWDDNGYSGVEGSGGTGGMMWAATLSNGRTNADGSPVRFSFYFTSTYIGTWGAESPTYVKRSWRAAKDAGHEIGSHTHTHQTSGTTTPENWATEMDTCTGWLTKPFDPSEPYHSPDASKGIGASAGELYGFRTPYLAYNDATLRAVKARTNFWYDSSIEEGFQYDQDGTNFLWPYTLDTGSPGHEVQLSWPGTTKTPITPRPGLWELPVHVVIVPPDDRCAEYGVAPGFRERMRQRQGWFDVQGGKITGFDFNLWVSFAMTKAEFLATLKYTLDQRLRGNRAPFHFGTHTDYYSSKWPAQGVVASLAERQAAIAEFIDYARSKPQVRVVSAKQTLDWIRNPVPLP